MEMLSIIVPCYNEEESILLFYDEIKTVVNKIHHINIEIIFVNDGSEDHTLEEIKLIAKKQTNIHYISLSRNFGKESAIFAGLQYSKGDYVVLMDADLQDPPSLLPKMLELIRHEDYDSIATRRVNRQGEPMIRSFCARQFYKIMNKISDADIVDGARDYRMMKRNMVNAILSMQEYNRFSKGIFGWIGFKTIWIEYENVERCAGETKWSFWKLFKYSLEGITAFSVMPLQIASIIGFVLIIASSIIFISVLFLIQEKNFWEFIVCLIMFIGGIQLLSLGVLGEYLSKTYLETKHRPIYITSESDIQNDK